ncbi:MAG: potassium transporter KefA [Dehalococcoidales bacterium]|jgi:small conductance mechanosensitive channel|nr:potassium transporter KefA [Dehalococcoidales bacterium]MDP6448707.1 mechanosensitive ion channel [Dehalococcoidales bacterium]MDP6824756.1 mechanosensitive ion channel [Dehalococcoidales bacterium]|tara:strand:- start:27 stop:1145 length:1119 start_codon:yes stop_codon:yes gene_type:complete
MWEWFTANSLWILMVAGSTIILLLFGGERVRDKLEKAFPEERRERLNKSITVVLWTVEGVALVVVGTAFAAITLSREGVHAVVTTETLQKWFLDHGISILIILALGIVLWLALKKFLPIFLNQLMAKPQRGESREGMKRRMETLFAVFMGMGKVLIVLLVIFMILTELNINIGPILASLGIIGIAVGFGAQYLIRDLIAGVFILLENQYRVGDVAKVADTWGLVEEVNLRKTVLRDLDGAVHHVPNGEIRVASNYTKRFARVNFNVPVGYGTDLDHAIRVINRVGQELGDDEEWGRLIKTVPQVLRVDNFGDSGIDIKILGDVKPLEQWKVMGELRYRLKKAFDAEGIEIPWPHTKVYFGNSPWDSAPPGGH